jgi:transcriptional regulator with XRE-family HTH domain/aromatic ring-cleaving dioxygenase
MDKKVISPGEKLKRLRESLNMTLRDVEQRSEDMARDKNHPDYILSKGWLNEIENGSHIPSIFKLYTLSAIYCRSWAYLNSLFNLRMSDLAKDQVLYGVPRTRLLSDQEEDSDEAIVLPIDFRTEQLLGQTNLLTKLVVHWGEVPIPLLRLLSPDKALYGFVGLDDGTLSPLIRPGSFVQIDVNQTKVLEGSWASEYDRPVYFVELRDRYACGWCQLKQGVLSVIPHPLSGCEVRQFEHPREAEVIGRVIGVAMRIAKSAGNTAADRGNKR